jgi:diguanylate cyclase (GGDEF)-like protein/PAS domain S-box-containing protein
VVSSDGALSPAFVGRLAGIFFLVAGVATAVSLALPLPQGQDRAAIAAVSFVSVAGGLAAWRAPWPRWPLAAMRWTLAPGALALIAAANYSGGLNPYTADVGFPLVFAWVGLSQPRGTSLRLAAPAAVAYLLPLLAASRPAGDLFTVALVIPVFVGLGEGCAWVASRLRAAEGEVRAAGAGIERMLEATTALGRAETEAEAAALTADLFMDLLSADRVQVMAAEEGGSSRFVSRGQRNIPVPLGDSVVDAATETSGTGLAVRGGQTVFVSDSRSSPLISPHLSRLVPSASAAFIPLPGEGGCLGAVVVLWDSPRAGLDQFSQRAAEVLSGEAGRALERTLATARLAQDLGERRQTVALLRRERAFLQLLEVVAVAANEARTVDEALERALDAVCAYTAWPVGHAYLPDPEGVLAPTGLWHLDDAERFRSFRRATEHTRLRPGGGLLRGVILSREPAWVPDITTDANFPGAAAAREAGLRAAFGLPVLVNDAVVAVLEFFFPEPLEPDATLLDLARHVGTQLGRVVERRRSEETLQASEERIRAVIDTADDAFIGMDGAGMVTEWNRRAEGIFGWSREEVVGQPVADLIIPEDLRSPHQAGLRHFLDTGEGTILGRRLELRARARDGQEFPVELTVWSTRVGTTVGFSAFVRDISERKRLEAELIRQTLHDPLTGLPNRTLLLDRLSHALTRAERSHAPVTVLFLDLDSFKTVNDSLGHAAGDRLLAAVAARLGGAIRPPDTVARLGGDEFAVLLEDTGTVDGVRVAQRLGEALDSPFDVDGHHLHARASIGVASGNPGEQTADDLLRNADLAMYIAKGHGKAGYAVFESGMHVALLERLELEADLRRALGLGELFLLYQPVVRLANASVVGMEALIRWKRAGGDVVSPLQFIPVAEETGLITEIGRWVLQEACRQAAAWQAEYTPTPALRLSVNLSARQLQDPGLVKDVEAVLGASGLEPECLVIEITESLLMSEPDVAIQRLRDLKNLGVWLAIDDFGTGYSSLSYLRRFPVDVLKIDRSFVTVLGGDPEDAALAHAIVKLGHTLQLRIVAEGIETPAQLAELQAIQCEYGQGYLFARPLTADAMSAVLADAGMGRGLLPPGFGEAEG